MVNVASMRPERSRRSSRTSSWLFRLAIGLPLAAGVVLLWYASSSGAGSNDFVSVGNSALLRLTTESSSSNAKEPLHMAMELAAASSNSLFHSSYWDSLYAGGASPPSNKLLEWGLISKDQLELWQEVARRKPIYVDLGLSESAGDTTHHLRTGYAVLAVDAYEPWIEIASRKSEELMQEETNSDSENALLLIQTAVADYDAESAPFYYKKEGDPISSLVKEKGCQNAVNLPRCQSIDVPVVRCQSVLELLPVAPVLLRVEVEMLQHSCLRALASLPHDRLPQTVCWQEHDKPVHNIPRPLTDIKMMLSLYELGYNKIKLVMQGPGSTWKYYETEPFGTKDGSTHPQTPNEMMHYRSYEYHPDGHFDTAWVTLQQVLKEGVFGYGPQRPQPSPGVYFDICMKLAPDDGSEGLTSFQLRQQRQQPENLPLASFGTRR